MKCFFLILLASLGLVQVARAGDLRSPEVAIRQPLDLRFGSIAEIQAGSTIHNAIEIRIPGDERSEQITVSLVLGDKEGLRILGGALVLRLAGSTNSIYEQAGSELILTESPTTLILHKRAQNSQQDAYLYFDLIVRGMSFAPPRDINFILNFSRGASLGKTEIPGPIQLVKGSVSIPPLQEFEVEAGNRRPILFNSIADYTQGITIDDYYFVRVRSNIPWVLTVKPIEDAFVPMTSPASDAMPPSIIKFRSKGSVNFVPLTPAGTQLASSSNVSSFDERLSIALRFEPGISYRAGIYNMNFNFSLSAP